MNGVCDGPLADRLLLNPAAGPALIANLVDLASEHGYGGYVFDLENISPAGAGAVSGADRPGAAALKPLGREVWVAAPFADDSGPEAVRSGGRHAWC